MHEDEPTLVELTKDVILPEWLTKCLPPHKPRVVISWRDGAFHATGDDFEVTGNNLQELYDEYNSDEVDVVLDDSVNGHGGNLMGGMFFCEAEPGAKTARLLLGMDDEEREALLKSKYKSFMECQHPAYIADPGNWVFAYNWLQHHPVFWYRTEVEPTSRWITDDGLKSLWVAVSTRDNGTPVVMMEHGAHVEDDYTHHYHDFRLDVYASNFEDGYVQTAKLVHKFFNPDGTEREGVEYEKSELELELERRVAELND